MSGEIVMPRMGLTMETGTVVRWLKKEGEVITAGEPLLEIETDKATVEIEALEGGTLSQIVAAVGAEVPIGGVIAYFLKPGEAAQSGARTVASAIDTESVIRLEKPAADAAAYPITVEKAKASPAARRLAKEFGLELTAVPGSGPGGRIVVWNVAAAAKLARQPATETQARRVSPVAQRVAADIGVDLARVQASGPGGTITRRDVELAAQSPASVGSTTQGSSAAPVVTPFTRIQRVMAERMVHSFTTAPHFYLRTEVDARQLVSLRDQLLPRLEQSDAVRLTYTDLFIYFSARTLGRHAAVMAQWMPEGLKQASGIHVGLAIETENGLLVPVLKDADKLGLVEIARRRSDMAERARIGKLLPDEFEEGVFTITNLGMYRVDAFDAILNPPQAAILAVGRIRERALVENGQVIAAPMLTLSLSVDHRVLDGARAAMFLGELAEMLETPALSMK